MPAFLRPIGSIAFAIAATSSLAQAPSSPIGDGFFRPNASSIDDGYFRPTADLAPTAPSLEPAPAQPAQSLRAPQGAISLIAPPPREPAPEGAELARLDKDRREIQQRREDSRMIDLERQNELNRRNTNPAIPPAATPAS